MARLIKIKIKFKIYAFSIIIIIILILVLHLYLLLIFYPVTQIPYSTLINFSKIKLNYLKVNQNFPNQQNQIYLIILFFNFNSYYRLSQIIWILSFIFINFILLKFIV